MIKLFEWRNLFAGIGWFNGADFTLFKLSILEKEDDTGWLHIIDFQIVYCCIYLSVKLADED